MKNLIVLLLPVVFLLSSCSEEKICIPIQDPPKEIVDKYSTPDWGNPEYLNECIDHSRVIAFDLNCANKYAKGDGGVFFDMAISLESGMYTFPAQPRPDLAIIAFEESARLGFPDAHLGIAAQKCISTDPNVVKEGLTHLDMAEQKELILSSQEQIDWWRQYCGDPILQQTPSPSMIKGLMDTMAIPQNKRYDNHTFASNTLHKACNESLIDQPHYDLFMDVLKNEDALCTMSLAQWLREGDFKEFIDYMKSTLGISQDKRAMLVSMCHLNMY